MRRSSNGGIEVLSWRKLTSAWSSETNRLIFPRRASGPGSSFDRIAFVGVDQAHVTRLDRVDPDAVVGDGAEGDDGVHVG